MLGLGTLLTDFDVQMYNTVLFYQFLTAVPRLRLGMSICQLLVHTVLYCTLTNDKKNRELLVLCGFRFTYSSCTMCMFLCACEHERRCDKLEGSRCMSGLTTKSCALRRWKAENTREKKRCPPEFLAL